MRRPVLTALALTALLAPMATADAASWAPSFGRVAGSDRYGTAAATAPLPNYDGVVFVASGMDYPDALAAGPAAAAMRGPVLLVPRTGTIPSVVVRKLEELDPDVIVIMGGTGAIDSGVERQLKKYAPLVDRVVGANRFDTAAQAADFTVEVDDTGAPTYPYTAVIASGSTFADALAGAAGAARQGAPLLLTAPTRLPAETAAVLEEFQPRYVKLLGGPAVISTDVEAHVRALLPDAEVKRLAGSDRYATAVQVARGLVWNGEPGNATAVVLVNGSNFPDALAAAPLAAQSAAPVLLTKRGCAPTATVAEVQLQQPDNVIGVGGTGVLSDAALHLKACAS